MPEPIPSTRLRKALSEALLTRRNVDYFVQAPIAARPYIQLRFYVSAFPGELSPEAYAAHREEACAGLGRDDIQYLLQHESSLDEVKFLTECLRAAPTRREPADGKPARPRAMSAMVPVGVLLLAAAALAWAVVHRLSPPQAPDEVPSGGLDVTSLAPEIESYEPSCGAMPERYDPRPGFPDEPPPHPEEMPGSAGAEDLAETAPPPPPMLEDASARPPEPPAAEPSGPLALEEDPVDPSQTLRSLGGVAFGSTAAERLPVIAWAPLGPGDDVATCGVGYGVRSPALEKSFSVFGDRPMLWVSGQTRTVYGMEFEGRASTNAAAQAEELVAAMTRRFNRPPVREGTDHVFRLGETTVRVGTSGGRLALGAWHGGLRRQAMAEFLEIRQAMASGLDAGTLAADSYPRAGMADAGGAKPAPGTPGSFCGLVFGSLAPKDSVRTDAARRTRYFFVDYRGLRLKPFRGFSFGRAEVGWEDGGLYAVTLYSDGAPVELDAAAYFDNLRRTLAAHYKVEPETKASGGVFPEHVFHVGDVDVTLGPEARGGFVLRAVNRVLAARARRGED